MKRFLISLGFVFGCGIFLSYDADASQYQTVTVTESYGSTGTTTVTTYASTGSQAVLQRQPVRNVIRKGRSATRWVLKKATAPVRRTGSCG